ncbi:MAG TPA: hypothetical protein VLL03_05775 [Burkholderiales bacterium]|nr:hypothetical protein [Burkholderiales bacterium]
MSQLQKTLMWMVSLVVATGIIYLCFKTYISPASMIDFANTQLC